MQSEKWELVEVIYGDLQAELLRGLLEAQGIQVLLSQEGAGHNVYPVLMGPLAKVEVLVHNSDLAAAKEVVEKYRAGEYRQEELEPEESAGDDEAANEDDINLEEDL
jgi:hypothetical protein